ncbi:MAG: aldehyde dehydrogenase family protein [Betaproteobacteria bacterium]|nr:aldehyde dehydrogenase family protein [Betaproteobacteria bacterium]
MKFDDGISALPLWIDGRAYLNVAEDFADVRNVRTGEIIYHVPLCGPEEAERALAAARRALSDWAMLAETARRSRIAAWGNALEELREHFAQILMVETGVSIAEAEDEITRAVEWLYRPPGVSCPAGGGIVALYLGTEMPLVNAARTLSLSLGSGATAVVKPASSAPSAVFALIELSAHAGMPPGVVNLIHGEDAALDAIAGQPGVLPARAEKCLCAAFPRPPSSSAPTDSQQFPGNFGCFGMA